VFSTRFTGKLHQFSILPPQPEGGQTGYYRYWVQMDSMGITKPGSSAKTYTSSSIPVVLDTGSTISHMPSVLVQQLASDFGATVDSSGEVQVPCSTLSQSGTVDFTFGNLTLHVPFKEFIWQIDANTCVVGAAASDSDVTLLGDTFLRSVYGSFTVPML
jgi:hypothetical protein